MQALPLMVMASRFSLQMRALRDVSTTSRRAVSSAVEHCSHTAGATGSIPVPPTNNFPARVMRSSRRSCECRRDRIPFSRNAACPSSRPHLRWACSVPARARGRHPPVRSRHGGRGPRRRGLRRARERRVDGADQSGGHDAAGGPAGRWSARRCSTAISSSRPAAAPRARSARRTAARRPDSTASFRAAACSTPTAFRAISSSASRPRATLARP